MNWTSCQWVFGQHDFCENDASYLVADLGGNEVFLCKDHFLMLLRTRVRNITKIVSVPDGKNITAEFNVYR